MAYECVLRAWHAHQTELRSFLSSRLPEPALADDLLQDVFFRAMREGRDFCELHNPRAWLFRVARNALTDHLRLRKHWVPVPVDELAACLARVLPELPEKDRDILVACDLGPMSQEAYARSRGVSLAAAKGRIRRARERLRSALATHCGVRFDADGRVCCHGRGKTEQQAPAVGQ